MSALLRPFVWLDTRAQRVVDATMFFVMRRTGWPKSFIRYAMTAIEIVALAGYGACALKVLPAAGAWIVFALYAPVTLWSLMIQRKNRRADEAREKQGVAWDWLNPSRWLFWAFVAWDAVRAVNGGAGEGWNGHAAVYWVALGLHVAWVLMSLANIYAERTPPRPPAERETERAPTLVPARSAS